MDSKIPILHFHIMGEAIKAHAETNHYYDKHGNNYPCVFHLSMTIGWAYKYIHLVPELFRSDVLSAIWFHDTLEDARWTWAQLKDITNERIANLVYAVTNEKGKSSNERANQKYYDGINGTPYAGFVKLCDRLANVQYGFEAHNGKFKKYQDEHGQFLKLMNPVLVPHKETEYRTPMLEMITSFINNEPLKY